MPNLFRDFETIRSKYKITEAASFCTNAGIIEKLSGGLFGPPGSLWLYVPGLDWAGVRLCQDTGMWGSELMYCEGGCDHLSYVLSLVIERPGKLFEPLLVLESRSAVGVKVSFDEGDRVRYIRDRIQMTKRQLASVPWPASKYAECAQDFLWGQDLEPFGLFEEREYRVMGFPWPGFAKLFGVEYPIWHEYLERDSCL